jgi:hypothetical protein
VFLPAAAIHLLSSHPAVRLPKEKKMNFRKSAIEFVAAAALVSGPTLLLAQRPYQQNWEYNDDRGRWDAPHQEYRDIERLGFRDGEQGAWRDFENHRRPDVRNRDEFRRPHVPDPLKAEYREAFSRGYDAGVQRILRSYSGQRPYGWR